MPSRRPCNCQAFSWERYIFLSLQVEDTSTSSTSRQYILYYIILYYIILYCIVLYYIVLYILYYIILYYICMLYTYWITNVYIWKYNIAWTRNKLDSETSLTGDHCAPFHSEQDNTRSELKREIVQINNHSWWIRLFWFSEVWHVFPTNSPASPSQASDIVWFYRILIVFFPPNSSTSGSSQSSSRTVGL